MSSAKAAEILAAADRISAHLGLLLPHTVLAGIKGGSRPEMHQSSSDLTLIRRTTLALDRDASTIVDRRENHNAELRRLAGELRQLVPGVEADHAASVAAMLEQLASKWETEANGS